MNTRFVGDLGRVSLLAGVLGCTLAGVAQQAPSPNSDSSLADSVRELRQQVQALQEAVAEIRSESQKYRMETIELRRQLTATRTVPAPQDAGSTYAEVQVPATVVPENEQGKAEHAASLEEEYQLLSGKIDDQYQTKVESASKYRVRLSGIVLLNLFSNRGTVDNIDFPSLAYENRAGSSGGSFGGTLRQSQVGLEVFGPHLFGARTRGDVQMDFGGGFSESPNGVTSGLFRLRTGTMRMDWEKTSIVAGQDGLFFSPNSPTSFSSLAVPALSYAGNLWSWVPQLRIEHRVSVGEDSGFLFQGGILDPLSGQPPTNSYYRQPQAGELSRQPAYASRVAWTQHFFGQPLEVGAGGYYSRQDYGFGRTVDAWSGMADLDMPLPHHFELSGKFYRGRGVGGLAGGIGRSVLFSDNPYLPATQVQALNSIGGWAQLKYRATSTLEFNGAFGQDNPYAADVRAFPFSQAYGDPTLVRNQGSFINAIYRPRSDLLLSAEYQYIRTFTIDNSAYSASHISLSMGVLF